MANESRSKVKGWIDLGRETLNVSYGSAHYKKIVEPLDLIEADGNLEAFCLSSIHKYTSRFNETNNMNDLVKIANYANILAGYLMEQVMQQDLDF